MSTIGASWQQESARCQNTRTQEGGLSTHLIASNVDSLRAGVLVRAAPSNVDANDSDRRWRWWVVDDGGAHTLTRNPRPKRRVYSPFWSVSRRRRHRRLAARLVWCVWERERGCWIQQCWQMVDCSGRTGCCPPRRFPAVETVERFFIINGSPGVLWLVGDNTNCHYVVHAWSVAPKASCLIDLRFISAQDHQKIYFLKLLAHGSASYSNPAFDMTTVNFEHSYGDSIHSAFVHFPASISLGLFFCLSIKPLNPDYKDYCSGKSWIHLRVADFRGSSNCMSIKRLLHVFF